MPTMLMLFELPPDVIRSILWWVCDPRDICNLRLSGKNGLECSRIGVRYINAFNYQEMVPASFVLLFPSIQFISGFVHINTINQMERLGYLPLVYTDFFIGRSQMELRDEIISFIMELGRLYPDESERKAMVEAINSGVSVSDACPPLMEYIRSYDNEFDINLTLLKDCVTTFIDTMSVKKRDPFDDGYFSFAYNEPNAIVEVMGNISRIVCEASSVGHDETALKLERGKIKVRGKECYLFSLLRDRFPTSPLVCEGVEGPIRQIEIFNKVVLNTDADYHRVFDAFCKGPDERRVSIRQEHLTPTYIEAIQERLDQLTRPYPTLVSVKIPVFLEYVDRFLMLFPSSKDLVIFLTLEGEVDIRPLFVRYPQLNRVILLAPMGRSVIKRG